MEINNPLKLKNSSGFTLIELLTVIAIIAILSTVAVTAYIGTQRKAARTEAYSNLQNLRLLEEQFFAENGRYTIGLGANGNTFAVQNTNLATIQDTANDADIDELRGFRPGNDSNFVYWTMQNVSLPAVPGVPFNPASVVPVVPPNQCFVAFATGIVNTRVNGDVFAIDCNNVRNF